MLKSLQQTWKLLNYRVSTDQLRDFIIAISIFLVIQLFFILLVKILKQKLNIIQDGKVREVIYKNLNTLNWVFYFAISLRIAAKFIETSGEVRELINQSSFILITFFTALIIQDWLIYLFGQMISKNRTDNTTFNPQDISLITSVLRILVWTLALIFILPNLGVNVTALVASLGISGIAIALALQNILSDIFASFSIYFDRPFQVGDFIEVGTDKGVVQRIGLRSTRIKALQGEEVVISNKDLTTARIHNFKLLQTRRVSFCLYLNLKTEPKKIREIPSLIEDVVNNQKKTRFDRAHLKEIGEKNLVYEIVYFIRENDYNIYMNTQQEVNLGILEGFKKLGVDITGGVS